MAVREGQDRRVGGGPEKLLTLEEAAQRLQLSPDDLEGIIRSGQLPAFRLGGNLLRVRLKDVDALNLPRGGPSLTSASPPVSRHSVGRKTLFRERVLDFFYFNDFYVVALLILLTLLALLVAL